MILFTNICSAYVGRCRTFTNALLLAPEPGLPGLSEPGHCARGFGPDPAWPTFEMRIPSLDYKVAGDFPIELQITDGPVFQLQIEDAERPLDVEVFDTFNAVWNVLPNRVARYWRAPAMPSLVWSPAEILRRTRPW